MDNLIGRDGRPLQLCGLALPFRERAGKNLPIASTALDLTNDVPLVWQHESDYVVCDGHRVELLATADYLFFAATLPATAAAQHAANLASFGGLRVSVETNDFSARVEDGIITKTRLSHIGLTTTPAHDSTIVWRADFAPDSLTEEQRQARSYFAIAAMCARSKLYQPPAPPSAQVVAFTKNLVAELNAAAPLRKQAKQRELAAADRIIDDANLLLEGRRSITATLQAARRARPGIIASGPGRRSPFDGAP